MKHTELWNTARKLKLGSKFLEDLDTLLTSLESNNKQLIITDVVKSSCDCIAFCRKSEKPKLKLWQICSNLLI